MKTRNLPSVNSGPMADIAFLLLIFFLIAANIQEDKGIPRKLPLPGDNTIETKKRNTLIVLINRQNRIFFRDREIRISELRGLTKEFIENPANLENLPEKEWITVHPVGNVYVTKKHIISLQNDRGTTYGAYIAVQNEITAAYNELREEFAKKKYGKTIGELDDPTQSAIEKIYPLRISESEPKSIQ